jgi:hypothetical protein
MAHTTQLSRSRQPETVGASPSDVIINEPALMEYKFLCFFGVFKNQTALFMKAPQQRMQFSISKRARTQIVEMLKAVI